MALRGGAELLALVAGAATIVYVARTVPPQVTGDFAVALALLPLVDLLTAGGLTQALGRRIAAADGAQEPPVGLGRVVAWRVSAALVLILLLEACAHWLPPSLGRFVRISALGWAGVALDLDWLFVARGHIATAAWSRAFGAVSRLLLIVALVPSVDRAGLLPVALIASVWAAVAFAWLLAAARGSLRSAVWALRVGQTPSVPRAEALQFMLGDVSVYAFTQADRFLVYALAGAEATGLYHAASRLVQPLYSVSTVVTSTLYRPLASAFTAARSGELPARGEALQAVLARYFRWMLLATAPVGPFTLLFSDTIISLAYGSAYRGATPVLAVCGWAITFAYLNGALILPLKAWGMPGAFTRAVALAGTADVAGCLLLVPALGATGAAMASLAGMITATAAGYFAFRAVVHFPLREAWGLPLAASAAAWAAGLAGRALAGPLMGVACFAVAYLSVSFVRPGSRSGLKEGA